MKDRKKQEPSPRSALFGSEKELKKEVKQEVEKDLRKEVDKEVKREVKKEVQAAEKELEHELEEKLVEHPEDEGLKADVGSEQSMDASDPSAAAQPGTEDEPVPSSGFPE